jgi:hypothetical protein
VGLGDDGHRQVRAGVRAGRDAEGLELDRFAADGPGRGRGLEGDTGDRLVAAPARDGLAFGGDRAFGGLGGSAQSARQPYRIALARLERVTDAGPAGHLHRGQLPLRHLGLVALLRQIPAEFLLDRVRGLEPLLRLAQPLSHRTQLIGRPLRVGGPRLRLVEQSSQFGSPLRMSHGLP